jgi:hypothetical protein
MVRQVLGTVQLRVTLCTSARRPFRAFIVWGVPLGSRPFEPCSNGTRQLFAEAPVGPALAVLSPGPRLAGTPSRGNGHEGLKRS